MINVNPEDELKIWALPLIRYRSPVQVSMEDLPKPQGISIVSGESCPHRSLPWISIRPGSQACRASQMAQDIGISAIHRSMECPKLKGTHKDYRVQPLAPHSCTVFLVPVESHPHNF